MSHRGVLRGYITLEICFLHWITQTYYLLDEDYLTVVFVKLISVGLWMITSTRMTMQYAKNVLQMNKYPFQNVYFAFLHLCPITFPPDECTGTIMYPLRSAHSTLPSKIFKCLSVVLFLTHEVTLCARIVSAC